MILFNYRPSFEEAWAKTDFRVVMGGMGDDTAMLIAEMYKRGYEPDEIVFCDTGSEFQHTYEFIGFLRSWCNAKKWSKVVVLRKWDKHGEPLSVIGTAEANNDLPAAAFGKKTCSLRYKTETADKYFNNHPKAWAAWGVDGKGKKLNTHTGSILRIVGINADEPNRAAKWQPEDKWCQVFPLFDWDIGEKESLAVEEVGLYYPGKSSCICCPHLTGGELYMLKMQYPEDYERVRRIEKNYQETKMTAESTTIGLCRGKTIDQKLNEFLTCGVDRAEGGKCEACK
jgi:3'-phosphoadenosine 5'-phosphosulfate sulfotransferase (PAPS reductase)/FAD synthetase